MTPITVSFTITIRGCTVTTFEADSATLAQFASPIDVVVNDTPIVTAPMSFVQEADCGFVPVITFDALPPFVSYDETTGEFTLDSNSPTDAGLHSMQVTATITTDDGPV
jgi:hypothetical protein